jgi:hypothetical protein
MPSSDSTIIPLSTPVVQPPLPAPLPAWQSCPYCGSVCSLPRVCLCPQQRQAPARRRPWWHPATWWHWLRRSKDT